MTDNSNGAVSGCGLYGSDGTTYNKIGNISNISQPQLQYLLEGFKHDRIPIQLASVELGGIKFLYIRELDDGRNVHVFRPILWISDPKDCGSGTGNKHEYDKSMLFLQSSNEVTMVALFDTYDMIVHIPGLNRMNEIIQYLKKRCLVGKYFHNISSLCLNRLEKCI